MMDCFCYKPRPIRYKIVLLDETELINEIQDTTTGQAVLEMVFRHLNLLETAYFGLRYLDQEGQTHWLDPSKKLNRQLRGTDPFTFYFGVKFYAADPCKLLEEITRYQFFLQVKQDILQGRLPVTFELAAELGAYIVQSELGDYDQRRHSPGYVSEFRFLSNQTLELESRIAELHKTLTGQLPSVAELNYLDKVKWLEMYGVDLHPVLGEDNVEYFLGLTPSGIVVLRNKNTVGNYYWPRISKIYFKGRFFMLRVTDKNNDESTYGFETPSKPACKHLWKCCVEHHAFFRLVQVSPTTPDIFALGSRFRYSGRTEKQAVRDAQQRLRSPPSFSRTPSRRYQRRIVEGAVESPKLDEQSKHDHYKSQEIKHVSIPQPAQSFDSPYKATCNGAAAMDVRHQRGDSPRSTRSAPWAQPHSRGLYNTSVPPSPRSVRSAGPRYRSSSIDSQSSTDSRSCKRRRHHRSRWTSDNESELSKCSSRSHRKHRRHRSRGKRDSGSENDSHSHKHKSLKNRHCESHYELVDSGSQWREIQKRQEANNSSIQQANVVTNRRSGYINSGLETESESSCQHRNRRHRKHRSRSRSPSEAKAWLPDELKKHLEFDLIDTTGMSETQLREIPYTVVQTNHAKQLKLKHMNWGKSDTSLQCGKHLSYSPPPPYSPQPCNVDKVRGIRVHMPTMKCDSPSSMQMSHATTHGDFLSKATSSIASSSSTNSNSNMLPRMLESLGLSDYPNQAYNRNKNKMGSSALYGNPSTLLGGLNGNMMHDQHSEMGTRVSHEHTDSGLGGEQDCMYNTERSGEGMKFGSSKMNGNEGRNVPLHASVSNDYKFLSAQDLYPNLSMSLSKNLPPVGPGASNSKEGVYKYDMKGKYGSSWFTRPQSSSSSSSSRQSVTPTVYSVHFHCENNGDKGPVYKQAGLPGPHVATRTSSLRHNSNRNAFPCSGDLLKPRLSAAECIATSHSSMYDGDGSMAVDMFNLPRDGAMRPQNRRTQSVRSRLANQPDTRSTDNNNFIYVNQGVSSIQNQNINRLHITGSLSSHTAPSVKDSKISTSPGHSDKLFLNGTNSPKTGESSEMSTEL